MVTNNIMPFCKIFRDISKLCKTNIMIFLPTFYKCFLNSNIRFSVYFRKEKIKPHKQKSPSSRSLGLVRKPRTS